MHAAAGGWTVKMKTKNTELFQQNSCRRESELLSIETLSPCSMISKIVFSKMAMNQLEMVAKNPVETATTQLVEDLSTPSNMQEQSSRNNKRERTSSSTICSSSKSKDEEMTWKELFESEAKKNIELHLQLCFVRGECFRLMGVQEELTNFLGKLQVSIHFLATF